MPIEEATYLDDLNVSNPVSTDPKSGGDDHIRLLKSVLKASFPGRTGPITFGTFASKSSTATTYTTNQTQDANADGAVIFFNTASGSLQYTLQPAATVGNGFLQLVSKSSDANPLRVQAAGAEVINGLNKIFLGPSESLFLFCDGTKWIGLHSLDMTPGTVVAQAVPQVSTGLLDCDGQAYSRATYIRLFEAITVQLMGARTVGSAVVTGLSSTANLQVGYFVSGTGIPAGAKIASVDSASQVTLDAVATAATGSTLVFAPYGIGDGSTTFNVPDLRGRALIGAGTGVSLTERIAGTTVGAETHTLTIDEMPLHGHPTRVSTASGGDTDISGGMALESSSASNYAAYTGTPSPAAGQQVGGTGGGSAHSNMQPSTVVFWRIKF